VGEPQESPYPLCATAQIKEFLEAAGFCRIWIPNYSLGKIPLNHKGREWEPMEWREEQKKKKKACKKLRGHSQMPLLWVYQKLSSFSSYMYMTNWR
jgi:hypothetical protein